VTPFFSSRWVEVPDWVREDAAGGLPAGFRAAGVAAGQTHQVHEVALQAERHRHRRVGLQRALQGDARLARETDVGPDSVVERARGLAVGGGELQA
jgi:hypothetical protein